MIRFISLDTERTSLKTSNTVSGVRWCIIIFNKNRQPAVNCSRKKYAKKGNEKHRRVGNGNRYVTKNRGNLNRGDLGRG